MDNLPKGWSDITVEMFIEFITNDKKIEYLLGIDESEIDELSIDEYVSLFKSLEFLFTTTPNNNFAKKIGDLHYKGLNSLTLGEFIDLEYFFSENYIENLPIIAAILWRKQKINEWDNVKIEPYEFDPKERSSFFKNLPISTIFGVIEDYLQWKPGFLETYAELLSNDRSIIDNEDELEPEEIEEIKKEIQEEEKLAKWSWELTLDNLSNGDITKYMEILNLPLILVMNTLSMKRIKS